MITKMPILSASDSFITTSKCFCLGKALTLLIISEEKKMK